MKALRYITAAAALVALAACNNNELDLGGFANDPDAVRIHATVGDLQSRSNPIEEDGADPTKFNTGDRIEVRTEEQGYVVYAFDGTNWNPAGSDYLKWNKETHRFSAYYPAGIYNVLEDQSTLENLQKSDLMEAEANLSKNSTGSISLKFKRRLARIVISKTIDWGTQYDDTYSVTDLRVHTIMEKQVKPYSGKDNYYAIVNSDNVTEPRLTFLTIKVQSSRPGSEEVTYTITGIPIHEAGKSYTYELKIGKDKAEISNVVVEDWETGGVISPEVNAEEAPDYTTSEADGVTTYHVYTAQGLQDVNAILTASGVTAATLASNISLECDITLPAAAEGGSNWTAIGVSRDLAYTGTFGGNGYTLTGLTVNSADSYQGLIAYLGAEGEVRHLTLADCTVKGSKYVGAVVGRASDGSVIKDCHVKATVGKTATVETKDDGRAGGIVGIGYGKISGCSLTTNGGAVSVIALKSCCGGIVGDGNYENSDLSGFHLSECFVSASGNGTITIQGTDCTGGIIGTIHGTDLTVVGVQDCRITNNGGTITVNGRDQVGGVVGRNWSNTAQNCYADGVQVTGSSMVGGLVGSNGYFLDKGYIIGSNSVKNCAVIGTVADDADYVHWDIGWNSNEVQDPAITDGGGNTVNIATE